MNFNDHEWFTYRAGRGPKPDTTNSLGRHERKCTVCEHEDREAIEQEFLHWYSPENIARAYNIPQASSIYRHAHALGLFERRRHMLRFALEPLIEQANLVSANASTVIRAIRTYARLDDCGHLHNAAPESAATGSRRSKRKADSSESES